VIIGKGNLWDFWPEYVVAITTNGVLNKKGELVMGKGVALQCKQRFPEIPAILGSMVEYGGNNVYYAGHNIMSFPTKHDWRNKSDIELIRRSAVHLQYLKMIYKWRIAMTKPGCGNGGLDWGIVEVKPVNRKNTRQ